MNYNRQKNTDKRNIDLRQVFKHFGELALYDYLRENLMVKNYLYDTHYIKSHIWELVEKISDGKASMTLNQLQQDINEYQNLYYLSNENKA